MMSEGHYESKKIAKKSNASEIQDCQVWFDLDTNDNVQLRDNNIFCKLGFVSCMLLQKI